MILCPGVKLCDTALVQMLAFGEVGRALGRLGALAVMGLESKCGVNVTRIYLHLLVGYRTGAAWM